MNPRGDGRARLAGASILRLTVLAAAGDSKRLAILLLAYGIAGFAASIAIQFRLATIDSRYASVALAWYPTAMYLGIATAPLIGAAALPYGLPVLIGAAVASVLLALAAAEASHLFENMRRDEPEAVVEMVGKTPCATGTNGLN